MGKKLTSLVACSVIGIGGVAYDFTSVEDVSSNLVIESEIVDAFYWKGFQYSSKEEIQLRYKTRSVSRTYTNYRNVSSCGYNSIREFYGGSNVYGSWSSWKYSTGTSSRYEYLGTPQSTYSTCTSSTSYSTSTTQTDYVQYYDRNYNVWRDIVSYSSSEPTYDTVEISKDVIVESIGMTSGIIDYNEKFHILIDFDNFYNYSISSIKIDNIDYDLSLYDIDEQIYYIELKGDYEQVDDIQTEITNTSMINSIHIDGYDRTLDYPISYILRSGYDYSYEQYLLKQHQLRIDEMNEIHNTIVEGLILSEEDLLLLDNLLLDFNTRIIDGEVILLEDIINSYENLVSNLDTEKLIEINNIQSRYSLLLKEIDEEILKIKELEKENELLIEELEWEKKNIFQKGIYKIKDFFGNLFSFLKGDN